MNDKEKIAAVVVTYNRKELLKQCLNALLNQSYPLDSVIVIDNASTDGTENLIKKEFLSNPKIDYLKLSENTGGAGGFYEGVKRGYEKGYDWLWLMDDDGLPEINCLENLLRYNKKGAIISPLVINIEKKDELSFVINDYKNNKMIKQLRDVKEEIYYKTGILFNGVLVSRKLIQNIGYPKKEMFIYGDETEYFYRAIKNNFTVITVTKAIHYHPKEKFHHKRILNLFYISESSSTNGKLRTYCFIRNKVYIIKKYFKFPLLSLLKLYIKYLLATLTLNIKLNDFIFFNKAFLDGFFEKWGKEKKFIK